MYCFKFFIAGRIRKTAAALAAVVFLFLLTGCNSAAVNQPEGVNKRPVRKRASDYSRIPGNYPASWQTSTVGS